LRAVMKPRRAVTAGTMALGRRRDDCDSNAAVLALEDGKTYL
jgi:hypothetical protein